MQMSSNQITQRQPINELCMNVYSNGLPATRNVDCRQTHTQKHTHASNCVNHELVSNTRNVHKTAPRHCTLHSFVTPQTSRFIATTRSCTRVTHLHISDPLQRFGWLLLRSWSPKQIRCPCGLGTSICGTHARAFSGIINRVCPRTYTHRAKMIVKYDSDSRIFKTPTDTYTRDWRYATRRGECR